jgi:hypothetical protein
MSSYLGVDVRRYSLLTATIISGLDLSASYPSLLISSINAKASSFETNSLSNVYNPTLLLLFYSFLTSLSPRSLMISGHLYPIFIGR